jgi:hypothetical protein
MRKLKKKSLCESCSNRIVIKYHGKYEGNVIETASDDKDCFYNFSVFAKVLDRYKNGHHIHIHVSRVIVDECSFYNKSLNRLNKPEINKEDTDSDSKTREDDSFTNGVTFVNIPGALLP